MSGGKNRIDISIQKAGKRSCQFAKIQKKPPLLSKLHRRVFFIISNINVYSILLAIVGFFLGRVVLLGELYPLGIAFVAGVFWKFRFTGVLTSAGVLLGLYSVSQGNMVIEVLTVIAVGMAIYFIPLNIKRSWLVVPGTVFSTVLVTKSVFLALTGGIPYDYISLIFEAIFAAFFTLAIIYALPAMSMVYSPGVLKGEELFCVMVLIAGIVAGANGISWNLLSLDSVLSYFFILVAALAGGVGLGASTGAVVGVIPGLAYADSPELIGAYAFSGLLAGVFRMLGKPGIIMGFLLGNIIIAVYMSSYGGLTAAVVQVALVALFFACVPWKWINELRASLSLTPGIDKDASSHRSRVKELIEEKTSQFSSILYEVAGSFEQTAASTGIQEDNEKNLQKLLDEIGAKVCNGCSHYSVCWNKDFYRTYHSLLKLFTIVDNYGRVTVDDLDSELASKCNRSRELVVAITCLYEMFKVNSFWSKRVNENKNVVSEQLKGISKIIQNLPEQLDSIEEHYKQESRALKEKLKKMGIRVHSLEMYNAGGDYPEVYVTMPSCGGQMICRYEIGPFVSRELGCYMSIATTCCSQVDNRDFCSYRVYPQPYYQLSLGIAGEAREGNFISGDKYQFSPLSGGKFAIMLSDGMGTGESAAYESSATLNLMTKLLDSGFSRDLAVKTINSILLLRSPQESFATMDMALFDIYNGQGEFIKVGASPGFVIRGKRVGTIRASSLPVGIVDNVELFSVSKQVNDGDMIVLVTDGVLDTYNGKGDREDWLVEVLQEVSGLKPQEVAELIINLARKGAPADDMTAVVVKIERVES